MTSILKYSVWPNLPGNSDERSTIIVFKKVDLDLIVGIIILKTFWHISRARSTDIDWFESWRLRLVSIQIMPEHPLRKLTVKPMPIMEQVSNPWKYILRSSILLSPEPFSQSLLTATQTPIGIRILSTNEKSERKSDNILKVLSQNNDIQRRYRYNIVTGKCIHAIHIYIYIYMSRVATKPTKWHLRKASTRISLRSPQGRHIPHTGDILFQESLLYTCISHRRDQTAGSDSAGWSGSILYADVTLLVFSRRGSYVDTRYMTE